MPKDYIHDTVMPSNYRRHIFKFFDQKFTIGAMARPDNNGACGLVWRSTLPSVEVLESWDVSSYVCVGDNFYYYDTLEGITSHHHNGVKSKKCCKFPLIRPISLAC
jgi:hypothetical protein